jgi:hypothetical protein
MKPFARYSAAQKKALAATIKNYSNFLQRDVEFKL